jgi:hypothetical protein
MKSSGGHRNPPKAKAVSSATGDAWKPPKTWEQLPVGTREKAEKVRVVMVAYYGWLRQKLPKKVANTRARAQWLVHFGESCNEKTIWRWAKKLESRGGKFVPVETLRIEAFCDWKSRPHKAPEISKTMLLTIVRFAIAHRISIAASAKTLRAMDTSIPSPWRIKAGRPPAAILLKLANLERTRRQIEIEISEVQSKAEDWVRSQQADKS